MAGLTPWQKKLHPYLKRSFLKSLAGCALLWLGSSGWAKYHDAQVPASDPAKREAELADIRNDLTALEKSSLKYFTVEGMQRELRDLDTSLIFFKNQNNAPAITIAYDEKALEAMREKAENDTIVAARKAEYRIMLSPYLSNNEFAEFATQYNTSRFGTAYMGALKDRDDEKYEPVPQLRGCQQEVAAKNGTAYNFDNNEAVYECVSSSFNMRSVALYGGGAGLLILGMVAGGLRRAWDDVVESEKATAPAATAPPPVTITVSTSQPVSMKPIRIIKRAVI